ncbi:Sphingoid long-chain base transporter RSB1 [Talaromyces pinophilus]|nr:Sphingoid long-chain base transporter RSB1 [Talaromyces pinophilus]
MTHPSLAERAVGYTDSSIPNPNGPNDTSIIIYGYTPSIALASLAAIWFFIHLILHTAQTFRLHNCWWWLVFSVGLIFEVVGYIARSLSAKKDPYNLIFFALNYFFIVTAPVFLAAGIYTILSILIRETTSGNRFSVVSPRLILGFFIASDVVSTVIQISGAVLVGIRESRRQDPAVANHILLGGLAYQVFAMSIFIVLSATFVLRARHALKSEGLSAFAAVFLLSTLMAYLRTVFRLAETAEGLFGKLATHEMFFGCLEFAPIALVALLLEVWHPGRCIGLRRERAFGGREKAGA